MGTVLIYSKRPTNRQQFIFRELIGRRLGASFEVTSDAERLRTFSGPKICYSKENVSPDALYIYPQGLLHNGELSAQEIIVTDEKWWHKVFFKTEGELPFDVFAASFYLLSRYEEYLPHTPDKHGRFPATASLAFQHQFLQLPLVDLWALQLKWQIENKFGTLECTAPEFNFLSTIDVDFAYRYRGIGFIRYWLKLFNEAAHMRWWNVFEQIRVGISYHADPYDTYEWIRKVCADTKSELRFFFLLCSGTEYDRNIQPHHDVMRNLIRKLSLHHATGLHPSYNTNENADLLEHERDILFTYTHQPVTASRQHYLRYLLPLSFMQLVDAGITEDYSTGYGSHAGFRASTCFPFAFYNLEKDREVALTLYPVSIMDVNFHNNPSSTPLSASLEIEKMMNMVKKCGGTFISIWHNSNLSRHGNWEAWREVFLKMHTLAASKRQQEID